MAKTETYIDFITDELMSGNVSRKNIMAKFVKKWQISERTFDRYFKIASDEHSKRIQAKSAAKSYLYAESQKEIVQRLILTADEKREQLAKIVLNPISKDSDKIRAIHELNKMDGDHSAQKVEDVTKGKFDDWTDEEIRAEIKRLEDI